MPAAVIHATPGRMDLRALTTMGMSAKPGTTTPIGRFGTGMKYALAVLIRQGCRPVLYVGRDRYTFSISRVEFRGSPFYQLRYRLDSPRLLKPQYKPLPFTTEYGKDWATWMAFRELEANTRDELGETWLADDAGDVVWHLDDERTHWVIDLPEYVAAFAFKEETFLPQCHSAKTADAPPIEVLTEGPRNRLYYRGLRALDLGRPSLRTYNYVADMELTEDRTLKYEFIARSRLASAVLQSTDKTWIKDVLEAPKENWEYNLEFPNYPAPGPAFMEVMAERPKANRSAWSTYHHYTTPAEPVKRLEIVKLHPRPWQINPSDPEQILDKNGRVILSKPFGYEFGSRWSELAQWIVGESTPTELTEPRNPTKDSGEVGKPLEETDDDIPF